MKLEKMQPGMVLWDRHRTKMGNTTMSRMGEWPVRIVSVDLERGGAMVSWNNNPARWSPRRHVEKYKKSRLADKKPRINKEPTNG